MATANRIRALNRLPFDFQDGLKVGGVDVTNLNQAFTPAGAGLIGFTPVGNLSAGNVQAALAELDNEKVGFARLDDTDGSSLVGYMPAGTGAVPTTVQEALRGLQQPLGFAQSSTTYRTGGGAVRQLSAGSGWSFIDDSGHAPWGWATASPVQVVGNDLRVTYDFTALEVGAFSVTPDERYAALGLTVGGSVGKDIADISGFAPISGRIATGTSGILFNSTSGNITSQVVDQAAGTITIVHGSQTHTDSAGSAVIVSGYAGANIGEFVVSSSTKTGFVLQYVRPLSCRITCTIATPGSEVFTVSQTENIGISAAWVAPGILRITHPSIGNNFPAATVNLWRTSAAAYQFKIESGGATTEVYFLNADGTSVTEASTNMIIAFSLPGKFPAAIPGGSATLGNVQRDLVPVSFANLSGPNANLWLSFAHPRAVIA